MSTPSIALAPPGVCLHCQGPVVRGARRALVTLRAAAGDGELVETTFHLACVEAFSRRTVWRVVAVCEYTPVADDPEAA